MLLVFFMLFCSLGRSQAELQEEAALSAATKALCGSEVAMLGESATHEDGHTHAFKVALVERLIDRCGFDAVLFEASHYQFLQFNRRLSSGQAVTVEDLAAAIGGLWRYNQEFQPLLPFLLARAQSGKVFLGGLDDQLGQAGQDYANVEMITELTDVLPAERRSACGKDLHHRVFGDFDPTTPYAPSDQTALEACLAQMASAVHNREADDPTRAEEQEEMISAAQRWIARDFQPDTKAMVGRDRSMFQDFQWLRQQQPKRKKVIVWGATVHMAKRADPGWADGSGTNFGSFVHAAYGSRAFSLGFSALTGSYRQGRQDVLEIPKAPTDSVELRTLPNGVDAVFVPSSELAAIGTAPGAFFRHAYETLNWQAFLDGVVVFRAEHPPSSTR